MALSRKPIEIVQQGNHQLLTKAEHWERVFLADIAQVQNGFAFKSEFFTHADGIPLIRIRDIENGHTENFYSGEYSEELVVRKDDILIGMDGDFNAAIWHGADGLLNQRVCRISPTTELFSKKFLFLCLQPYLNAINAETSSVTVKHLSSKTISEIPLPLPPLNEQHRTVAKIEELFSELDKGIENLKTAREQLKVYRQALLKNAFDGKLTAQWREQHRDQLESADALLARIRNDREQRYQQQFANWEAGGKQGSKPKSRKSLPPLNAEELAELPELPEGWKWVKLGEFIKAIEAGKSFKCDERVPRADEIGVAKVSAVTWGEYDESESKTCIDSTKENNAYYIQSGDFIISRANTIDLVGACVIARKVTKKIMLSDKTLRIKFDGFCQEYFLQYLRSRIGRKQIMLLSTGNQESMRNIGQDRIRSIAVPVCSGEEATVVMEALASKLSEVDQLDQILTTSLQQAKALRQSVLKKAFSGQLVAQDASDEPASVLLTRIKAETITQPIGSKSDKTAVKFKPVKTNVIPFPAKVSGISPSELHAGIMALAYQQHEKNRRSWYFGHVKAEKISHMVEAHIGIDLDRQPIQDAAGPNDFKRLLFVESIAREQKWFDVRKQKSGRHVLHKTEGFDELISRTSAALGEHLDSVLELIGHFIGWDKTRSEIMVTLYAAWNNLLILGQKPTDEEIVTKAYEDWHPDKTKIRRERFFKCLGWMRTHHFVPLGKGKYVAKK